LLRIVDIERKKTYHKAKLNQSIISSRVFTKCTTISSQ
jgi:hypothetical protein